MIVKEVGGEYTEETVRTGTMPEAIYSEDVADNFIRAEKGDLAKRMQTRIDHQVVSGWSVKRRVGLLITTYSQQPSKGSSCASSPPELSNSTLKLVDTKKEDEQCFE